MKRRLSIVVAVLAVGSLGASLTSCNGVACGPGTVQDQQPDGTLKCVPTDYPAPLTPCDTDGGNVTIVGGKCVSAIQCDPNTTMDINGVCVGSGMSGPAMCGTVTAGKTCVSGSILNFPDNLANAVSPINVALYDPQVLLAGGGPIATTLLMNNVGSYVFQNFQPPPLGLIVIVTGEGTENGVTMIQAATGDKGIGAGVYRVDAYALKKSDSDAWGGGVDLSTGGAVIGKFFHDKAPPANLLIANETMPAMGVTFLKDGLSTGVKYFNDLGTAIDGTLTATSMSGIALVPSPLMPSQNFPSFTGMGGGETGWEMQPGGSKDNLVLVTRFHPN